MTDTNAGRESLERVLREALGADHLCDDAEEARTYVATLVSAAAERDELQARFDRLADACARWGWEHCTSERELIEQVDATLASLASAERVVEAARVWAGLAERHYHATATEVNEIANELRLAVRAHATASEEKTDG